MSLRLTLRVTPRAGRDAVAGFDPDGTLRIRVAAPPAGGQANDRVIRVLARALGVPPRDVVLVRGARGRQKQVDVPFASVDEVARRLSLPPPGPASTTSA